MGLADFWLLHRDRILLGAGFLLGAASVIVLLRGAPSDQTAYETGSLIGAMTRNIVIGLVVGAFAVYLWRRFYWLDESHRWSETGPESVAIGGAVALCLALTLGVSTASGQNSSAPRTFEEAADDARDCFQEGSPMNALGRGAYVELTARQAFRINPPLRSVPEEVRSVQRHYVVGRGQDAVVVSFTAIGDSSFSDPDFWEDFSSAQTAMGNASAVTQLSDREGVETTSMKPAETLIATRTGCNVIAVIGLEPQTTRTQAESLLAQIES